MGMLFAGVTHPHIEVFGVFPEVNYQQVAFEKLEDQWVPQGWAVVAQPPDALNAHQQEFGLWLR